MSAAILRSWEALMYMPGVVPAGKTLRTSGWEVVAWKAMYWFEKIWLKTAMPLNESLTDVVNDQQRWLSPLAESLQIL